MIQKLKKRGLVALVAVATGALSIAAPIAHAVETISGYGLSMSPMDEKILLNPGDSYSSVVNLSSPAYYDSPLQYTLETAGYYVNDDGGSMLDGCGNYCEMKDWITLNSPNSGKLEPGESTEVYFTINVPYDAPGGGQYASIVAEFDAYTEDEQASEDNSNGDDITSAITEKKQMAHIIYAEVTGDVIHQGEIAEASVPGFILDGNISGTSTVKNTGNVHSSATYKLQVFPLFSDEEVYTNEENPDSKLVLPDRSLVNNTAWEETPAIGIYNVKYTVEFEGITTEVTKMVIKCPLWLLFTIIIAIVAIIAWLIIKSKTRKNGKK